MNYQEVLQEFMQEDNKDTLNIHEQSDSDEDYEQTLVNFVKDKKVRDKILIFSIDQLIQDLLLPSLKRHCFQNRIQKWQTRLREASRSFTKNSMI